MLNVECFRCGKPGKFSTASAIWVAGWQPITKDQYICDICAQLEFSNEFKITPSEESTNRDLFLKKKKLHD